MAADYRDLPPVEVPVERPERLSQTLLGRVNVCERSAYLYLRHGGGAPGPELLRGSAAHAVFEKMGWTALTQDETQVDSDTAAAIAEHVMEDWPLRARDRDDIRQMAFHLSKRQLPDGREVTGYALDPRAVQALERKFALDVEGWRVTCKLDVAAMSGLSGMVDDYKTGFDFPDQQELEADFQLRCYGVALVHGHPVQQVPAGQLADGPAELLEPPLGKHLSALRLRQLFPMHIDRDTGEVWERHHVVSRLQVETDFEDLKALVRRFDRCLETGKWQAIRGDHCTRCAAPAECPLPEKLRNHAGTINEPEQAAEAAEWLEATKATTGAVQRELRNVVRSRGPVRYGRDRELVLEPEVSFKTDQEGLREGVARAVTLGEPFDLSEFRRPQRSKRMKVRTLGEEELRGEREAS